MRYGHDAHSLEAFLDSPASIRPLWPAGRHFHSPLGHRSGGFAYQSSLPAWRVTMTPGPSSLCPPIAQTCGRGTGICTRCPSPTPSGLGLGPPNPSMISIATEPSGIRWEGFAPSSRYSCQHSHSWPLQIRSPSSFTADHDAPLPCASLRIRGFGTMLEPRWIVGAAAHRPVSYYALFQGWLLLSQPPGCHCATTTLPT